MMMPGSGEKKGKWLNDKVSEIRLKKKDITRQKAMHVKNRKVIRQEWKWLLVRMEALWVIFFSFCKFLFNDGYTVFSILKKNPKKGGGEQYRKTHRGNRVMHTDVLRKLHFQRHLPLYKT